MTLRFVTTALAMTLPALIAASPASAATVTNTYQVVSRFTTGAIANVTQRFTLTFNPALSGSGAVSGYSASVADLGFNPPSGVLYTVGPSSSSLTDTSTLLFGGAINGVSFPVAGTFDFDNIFFVAPGDGAIRGGVPLIPFSALTRYSNGGAVFETTNVTVSLVASAVPEAATWTMMIAGFGVIGGSLRVRRRSGAVRVRFA